MNAKVIQLIETTLTTRGTGKSSDSPIRGITQYWSFDGQLVAEVDPLPQHEELTRLRGVLEWLECRGGLGHDVHERITAALTSTK